MAKRSITLTVNIGKNDSGRLGLPVGGQDTTVQVEEPVFDELIAKGWGVVPDSKSRGTAKTKPAEQALNLEQTANLQETPNVEEPPNDEETPDLEDMTKEELHAFADERGIAGVSMAMKKDEMIATIEDALSQP